VDDLLRPSTRPIAPATTFTPRRRWC
jgi:hypothetical protein